MYLIKNQMIISQMQDVSERTKTLSPTRHWLVRYGYAKMAATVDTAQWSQNLSAGGEACGAGGRTCSVPREVARAGYFFCFVRQSEKSSVRNFSVNAEAHYIKMNRTETTQKKYLPILFSELFRNRKLDSDPRGIVRANFFSTHSVPQKGFKT
jgi:hypothetical protein